MKHLRILYLFIAILVGQTAVFADDNSGDATDEQSAFMAGKKVNAPIWQETDPSQSTDPTQTSTPYLDKRRALVGYNCQLNRIITSVGVGTWTSSITNLVDDDLDNEAIFPGVVGADVVATPIVGVRDLDNYYAAGTTVGFCLVANSGTTVLSLDVIKTMHIWLYCDGKRVEDLTVREGNSASGVKLTLIGVGNESACVNLTAVSTTKFDEVVLVQGAGLNAEVGGVFKLKYAFVGDAHDIYLTTNGIQNYCNQIGHVPMNVSCEAYMPSPLVGGIPIPVIESYRQRAIDDDLTNTVPLVSAVQIASVAFKGRVRVNVTNSDRSVSELFNAGDQVGFKFNVVEVLDLLSLGAWIDIKLYDHNGDETETITVSAAGLALSLASGGDQTSYVVATKPFSGAEITFYTALGVLDLGSGFGVYYAFVRPKPTVEKHHCDINASYGVNICENQTTYQLRSNSQVAVTWTLVSKPDGSACTVDANGYVRNLDLPGDYTFRATAEDGCYEDVTIHLGIDGSEVQCEVPVRITNISNPEYELSTEDYGGSGSLISISDLDNPENILDGNPKTYATYIPGGTLANNLMIVGVKTTDDSPIFDGGAPGAQSIRVGFVISMHSTGVDLNLLEFQDIRCYDGEGDNKTEVFRKTLDELGIIDLGIAGEQKDEKLRMVITVPTHDKNGNPIRFNEFQLWKAGLLNLDIDQVDICYPFTENVAESGGSGEGCKNAIMEGSNILNYSRDHAVISAENIGVVSVGDVINNLSNIIDDDPNLETYSRIVKAVGSGQTVISVKMGHIMDFRQQIGVVIDDTRALDVELVNVIKVSTYMNGEPTGEEKNEWKALGTDVVQSGDKAVILMTPSKEYDEIRITITNALDVAEIIEIYGIILRNDIDHDGISDVRDEESCSATINNMQVNSVCLNGTLHLEGVATTETDFYFIIPDQVSGSQGERFDVQSDQYGVVTLDITANKVGYQMPVYIYDGSGKLVGTAYYNVHPLQTTWKTNPSDTNWNEWSNWTNGSPYLCTDVIIPSNATLYPSLDGAVINGDEFGCDRIQFESRAAVEKVFKLNYTQAFVDVELNSDRYYLLSAPLQNVYTGDMFIALNGSAVNTPEPWQTLTGSNYQQNRFSPRIYQRLWEKTALTKLADGTNSLATIQETRWSKRFNALKYDYQEGEGFSLWVQPDRNYDRQFTFRLPKTHTAYNYYNEVTEEISSLSETGLERDNAYRFTYEQNQTPRNYTYISENDRKVFDGIGSLTVTLSAENSTQTFLVGNPFMSHINVQAFLEANADVISEVKTYNGNTHSSAIAVAGIYITTDETFTHIQPMEAFFVTAKTAGTSLSVQFDETMFGNVAMASPAPAFDGNVAYAPTAMNGVGQLRICASTPNANARALLVSGMDNVERETLFDNEAHPTLAVFTINDGRSLDINGTLADEIPLGIYLEKETDVTLSFHAAGGMNLDDYVLVDRLTTDTYSLDEEVKLTLNGSSINRFYLSRGNSNTRIEDSVTGEQMIVNWKNGVVSAEAPAAVLKGIEVFGYNGVLLAIHTLATPVRNIQTMVNEKNGVVRLRLTNGKTKEYKF